MPVYRRTKTLYRPRMRPRLQRFIPTAASGAPATYSLSVDAGTFGSVGETFLLTGIDANLRPGRFAGSTGRRRRH